jgi:beta-phosphoglucomutase
VYKLVIFDLDGVVTDTAEYHYLAWKQLANKIGIDIDREFNEQLKGVGRIDSLERILATQNLNNVYNNEAKNALADEKNEYYLGLINQMTPEDILPGIIDLLTWLKENGVHIALGSASRNAPTIVDKLGVTQWFDYIVNPDSVKLGKPAPDLFLKAAMHFDIEPERCIVVEDATSGIQAAKDGYMYAVGVGDKDVLYLADQVVESTDLLLRVFEKLIIL